MSLKPYIYKPIENREKVLQEKVHLSMLIDSDLFMYAVFSGDYTELLELGNIGADENAKLMSTADRIKFLVSNYRISEKKYENVQIAVLNRHFNILPDAFSVKDNSKELLNFTLGEQVKNTFTHHFNNLSFNYVFDSELLHLLEKTFKNASFRHAGAVAANLLFNNRSLKNCDVFLNLNAGVFELLAKKDNALIYYNVFEYENKEDVLYYLLFMMEQFEISAEVAKIIVAGQMEASSEIYSEIKRFVKNVGFAVHHPELRRSDDMKLPDHFYFTLLNQHLCEL
jgi:hypothetical protein